MANENEELRKRRERREAQRKKRLAQQRQLRLRLLAAGVVLAICAVVIFTVSRGSKTPGAVSVPQNTRPAVQSPIPTETAPQEPTTVIRLAAAGDLNVTDAVVASGGPSMDYTGAFLDVLPLLAEADLTTLNFEGSLVGQPYGSETMSAPTQLLDALVDAGVDMVQMANSRTIYNGISGLSTTLQTIRASGLEPLGAYATRSEFKSSGGYTIKDIRGVKVAFVAFTKGMDGMALPEGNENCVNLLYTDYATTYQKVDSQGISKLLKSVQEEAPDITVALLHWGSEYNDNLSETQEEIRSLMLDGGVDVIIGTHPHFVQTIEFDKEAGTLICYSLGDFFGDAQRPGTNYSIILNLEITKDNETGETRVTDYSYTPIYTVADGEQLKVVRIAEAMVGFESNYVDKMPQEAYDGMESALERIQDRVTPTEPEE